MTKKDHQHPVIPKLNFNNFIKNTNILISCCHKAIIDSNPKKILQQLVLPSNPFQIVATFDYA